MSETRLEYSPAVGRRVRAGSWEDQKISTYRKIREAIGERRFDDAAELGNYFIDEAKVCFAIYRQWIPTSTASSPRTASRRPTSTGRTRRSSPSSYSPTARPWDPFRQWHDFITRGGGVRRARAPRAGGRGAREARRAEGDVAALPRPRRRPHLRPHERDREAPRRGLDRRHVGQGAAPPLHLALREVRHRQARLGGGARDAHARRLRGDARPPRRPRAHGRHGADRDRRPLHPALRPVRLGRPHDPRRHDRGHARADGAALQLDGVRGAAHLEPR